MKNTIFKQDKGVAGLTIMLSLVVMLFIIGLLVMIFSIMGNKLQESQYGSASATVTNETGAKPTTAGIGLTSGSSATGGVCGAVTSLYNSTGEYMAIGNITQVGCTVYNNSDAAQFTTNMNYTYPYTYSTTTDATDVMGDTVTGISGVVEWFDIFIVIGAMVVLILLTVIIITAIRSSGMIAGSTSQGARSVGTA